MKLLCRVLIITLLFGVSVQSQSLAELARNERARRSAQAVRGTVYTSETLFRIEISEEMIAALQNVSTALEDFAAPLLESAQGVAGAGVDLARQMVTGMEEMEAATEQEIARLRGELASPDLTPEERTQLEAELADAERILSEVGVELQDARQNLAGMEAQVQSVGQGFPVSPAGVPDVADPELDVAASSEEERAAWEAAVAEQQTVVQDLEDRELRQQLEINRLRNLFTAPVTTQAERAQAQAGLEGAQTRLEATRTELEAARASLEDLLAQEPAGP